MIITPQKPFFVEENGMKTSRQGSWFCVPSLPLTSLNH